MVTGKGDIIESKITCKEWGARQGRFVASKRTR